MRVRVVRIGDSPLAPLFQMLEAPNGWDRQLKKIADAVQAARPETASRPAFWVRHQELYPDTAEDALAAAGQADGGWFLVWIWSSLSGGARIRQASSFAAAVA